MKAKAKTRSTKMKPVKAVASAKKMDGGCCGNCSGNC